MGEVDVEWAACAVRVLGGITGRGPGKTTKRGAPESSPPEAMTKCVSVVRSKWSYRDA